MRTKRGITPDKAREILGKYGMLVTTEQAGQILDFLYKIGNIAIQIPAKHNGNS